MAVVFVLGPGMWDPAKRPHPGLTPLQVRRDMANTLKEHGHDVVLMEDDVDREGEDLIDKFDRLLRHGVTDVVLYWPPLSKMQTSFDELILLCDRSGFLRKQRIRLWALHHSSVATITKDEFRVLESGHRSRYLTAVSRLGLRPLEWETEGDLNEQIGLLAIEL